MSGRHVFKPMLDTKEPLSIVYPCYIKPSNAIISSFVLYHFKVFCLKSLCTYDFYILPLKTYIW